MEKIGKYKVVEELGKGGMGVVYKAYDPLMERHVAIKVLSDWAFHQDVMKERFYREARASGNMSHENITIIHDLGEYEGVPYIVMEYLSGIDMRHLLTQKKNISLKQKLDYARQICSALAYSHSKNIVHRDIKPENVRVLDDGKIKIMDFGIARLTTSSMTMTMTGTVMGTPYYMSPEQVKGEKVGHESDIFSFGVLLYEMLTNQLPFPGDNPTTVSYKIVHNNPEPITNVELVKIQGLQDLILKCLEKKPENRFASAKEIIEILDGIVSQPGQPKNVSVPKSADPLARQFMKIQKTVTGLLKRRQYADALAMVNAFIGNHSGYQPAEALLEVIKDRISEAKESGKTNIVKRKPTIHSTKSKPGFLNKNVLMAAGAAVVLVIAFILFNPFSSTEPGGETSAKGYVALNIMPWAELVGLSNSEGVDLKQSLFQDRQIITPQRINLSPGEYTAKLVNPSYDDTLRIQIKVTANQTTRINQKLPGFDTAQALATIKVL